jgi:xanthine dehydrogenase accessory factor
MNLSFGDYSAIEALLRQPKTGVLAIIVGVGLPSYRQVGSMMAFLSGTDHVGSLSSGCIDADLGRHAMEAASQGRAKVIRYGRGSPFIDIRLPCGGELEILLLPNPDREVLAEVIRCREARIRCCLKINVKTGHLNIEMAKSACCVGSRQLFDLEPEIRFLVFGKGPEASEFASLIASVGYPHLLLSPDARTLDIAERADCRTNHLTHRTFPHDLNVDSRTAIVLFFHDHDWEPEILVGALNTGAFYIGAQGSHRARELRMTTLRTLGVKETQLDRLHGPVGLIPSARDPQTLAVSVLAEILAKAIEESK